MNDSHQALADREAIREQIYRYCRAMDRIDHQLGYGIWHPDGSADYGPMYSGSGRGFIDWVCEQHSAMLGHSHQVANILIQLDGDRAGSEAYVTATLRFRQEGRLMQTIARGRYVDRWSRRDGRWAIDHRTYIHDFDELVDVPASITEGWGRRDTTDPSYAVLGG
ncbi:MAG: nuclear transport factor 2 family protein [Porticoccaceae bacterium]|jgi:hypothetical protein|nr:nuclear transport factor 2 family protein [Porticoccaceae bacterium]MEA3300392.1 nuclear transport factor 2 family protein [Pseudomonadota bacterium]HLS98796.1 nuclear transport factor 2 family protein [Porticoccaceae bacterium]